MNKEYEKIFTERGFTNIEQMATMFDYYKDESERYKNIIDKVKSVLNEYKAKAYSDYDVDDVLSDLDYIFTMEAVNERLKELKGE